MDKTETKKATHSPGPWHLFDLGPAIKAGNRAPGPDGTAFRISAKDTLFVELIACYDGFVYGRNEANARLIAAAPELLAALMKHGKHAPMCSETNNAHCEVCAAIAKAEGAR